MGGVTDTTSTRRGRPPRYLLSGIAVCGVCGAPTRVGSQNGRAASSIPGGKITRYRVYECTGLPGRSGFHVSIRQDYLDKVVTDALLERVSLGDFLTPRARNEDEDGAEREALRFEIKSQRIWLARVQKEAELREMPQLLAGQERVVLSVIEAARARLAELEELDPLVERLKRAAFARTTWETMPLLQQRHIVRSLMTPRISTVSDEDRGMRGPNPRRVDLNWRGS